MVLVVTMASMQAQAQNRYGSIAFSQQPDGGYEWGITWNFESREAARSRAIAGCRREGGRSCGEIFWFRNTCGALAIGSGNGWGAGAGKTTLEAQRGAIEKCRARNRDCQIAVSRCAKASTSAVAQSLRYSSRRGQPKLRDRYGSIAFSQQGDGGYQWGFTWDFESREAARDRAITGCRSTGGRSCSEIYRFRNTCGALAIGGANGWGAGAGATTLEAQRRALEQCRSTNRNCQLAVSRCAKASTTAATAGSLSSAKAGSSASQRKVATRKEPKLTQAGRRKIQQALAASGFNPGAADGVFGPKTRAALRAWQTANGHAATGQLTSEQVRILQSGKRGTRPAAAPTLDEALAAYNRRDYATALKGFRFHAEQGNAAAQTNLGILYANGRGVVRDDKEAVRWYRKAARQGYANAQTNLGVMYDHGRGVRQNVGEALRLYRLAAAQGEPYAQNNLGNMYANGRGVVRNVKEAERWYRKAAGQGHADAQASLKVILSAGRSNTGFVTPPPPKRNLAELMRAEGVHANRVTEWLKEGLDPNARDHGGDTPLHYAATKPWPDGAKVVRLLISAGARCDARSNDGDTPLHVAAGTGDATFSLAEAVETVRLLLDCGANPNRRNNDGNTPLHTAFKGTDIPTYTSGRGDFDVVGALLRGGAKPNAKSNDGDTPLILAVQETDQYAKTVRVLLQHGANPDTRNRKGSAAVHLAAEETNPSVIAALLAGGADPDAKDKQGDAALHIVAKKRRERAKEVEALLAGGADPCVRDRKRNIPIAYPEEGSRANRLLASAGGHDWDCDEKAVAEAPKQKPQQEASRSKATTATVAKRINSNEPKPSLNAEDSWSWIMISVGATGDTLVWGVGRGDDWRSANKAATQECQRQGGAKCEVKDGFSTGEREHGQVCVALAIPKEPIRGYKGGAPNPSYHFYGTSVSRTAEDAKASAMGVCEIEAFNGMVNASYVYAPTKPGPDFDAWNAYMAALQRRGGLQSGSVPLRLEGSCELKYSKCAEP